MSDVPAFRHPCASRAYALVHSALVDAVGIDEREALPCPLSGRRQSFGRRLECRLPQEKGDRLLMLIWGFASDSTGPEVTNTGHIYASLRDNDDSITVLCRCGPNDAPGEWRLDVHTSRSNAFLSVWLDIPSSLPTLKEREALAHIVNLATSFRELRGS